MANVINTNIAANSATRNMTVAGGEQAKSIERLSSGLRINKAADDAAGLVIAEKLRAQGNGIKVAIRNANDGIGLIQTTDGALTEVTSMLHRMRDLAMHAANGATDVDGKAADQAEFTALNAEIDRIGETTKFGATALLAAVSTQTFAVGATAAGGDIVTVTLGLDTDKDGTADAGLTSTALATDTLDLTTGAAAAVAVIDAAIDMVTGTRASLGAVQNRFEHTVKNLGVTGENVAAAESQIRDTDMAAEMTKFTKQQVLQQASQAMLSQANSSAQGILQLLRG